MIEVKDLVVIAGEQRIGPIHLHIESGSHAVLEGPTGSGKTSLVEAIAGIRPTASGKIFLGDTEVTQRRPADRFIGYVPQDGVLFRTMSVRQNLGFGLRVRRTARQTIETRVQEIASRLSLSHLLERSTVRLSGGETQRVALGRALVLDPDILLMDEPFSAVDGKTRRQLESVLSDFHQERHATILHVSHSYSPETMPADVVVSMNSLNPGAGC